jgi:hypothetical protein
MVVVIRGATGGDPTYARAGELRFRRADDETFPAFQARAVAGAAMASERLAAACISTVITGEGYAASAGPEPLSLPQWISFLRVITQWISFCVQ